MKTILSKVGYYRNRVLVARWQYMGPISSTPRVELTITEFLTQSQVRLCQRVCLLQLGSDECDN